MDTAQSLAFRKLLTEAIKRGASDVHLTVGAHPMIRVDGLLRTFSQEEIVTEQYVHTIIDGILNQNQKERLTRDRDVVFTTVFDEKIRSKIHVFYQEGFPVLSFHFFSMTVRTPQELGIELNFDRFISAKNGLLIITGPRGSGRTTLTVGLLEYINRTQGVHIMTIEDPIEYNLNSNRSIVVQREVGSDVPTITEGLSAAAQEDVDILYVSDVKDADQMRTILELANSGMFIIVVFNTGSSVMALEKIVSFFGTHEQSHIRNLLAESLKGVVVQFLLPKIGGGVVSIHEILLNNTSAKTLIASDKLNQIGQLIKVSRDEGMTSIDHELATRLRNNEILLEHARAIAQDQQTLDTLMRI
jgi:twitching motility protein PilT